MSNYLLHYMTEKAENIIDAALELFVEKGYDGTTTLEISKKAKVSEALIFKHFKSKAGLMEAIVIRGRELLSKPVIDILNLNESKKIINATIDLPLNFYSDKSKFWKLLMDFKSKNPQVEELMHSVDIFEKLISHVNDAFRRLGYEEAENETNLLYFTIVGISKSIFEPNKYDSCKKTISFLKKKYGLMNQKDF